MQTFSLKSFRARYLLVAVITTLSTFIFITFVESYISSSNETGLRNVEQRLKVSQLNTRLHTQIQNAGRLLDLYLFTPTIHYRKDFLLQISEAKKIIQTISETSWTHEQNLKPKLTELKNIHQQLEKKSSELIKIRLDAQAMYPAMRLANGSMRNDNQSVISLINSAVYEQQTDEHREESLYAAMFSLRDKWRRTINAYRLYLINRLSSLEESSLSGQSTDVRIFHKSFTDSLKLLANNIDTDTLGIETEVALDEILPYADNWLTNFNEVDTINMTGAWRGDVPIILNDIYPLFDKIYSIINSIDIKISTTSSLDIQRQLQISHEVSYTLWGIEALLIFLTTFGYFILDHSLLKPLSRLSKSLRESSNSNIDILLPDSQTEEIEDFVKAYQHMQSQINARQEKLEHIAMHDDLTNLPNRALFINHITLAISNAQRFHSSFAIIILDLDRFKEVNDTLGHLIGDEVLKQVGARLDSLLRDTDTVARLGGDEFAVLLTNIEEHTITEIAVKISHELEKVYAIQEHSLYLGASLGVSIYPQHGLTTEILLKHADIAMYMAKHSDIDYAIYTPKNDEHNVKQLSLLSDLRQAIDLEQLRLFYQPIYNTQTNDIVGYEALIRWQHPTYGLLAPDSFIQLAEQTGLIKKITLWVIKKSLSTFKTFNISHDNSYVSINVTAWDLQDSIFHSFLTEALHHYDVKPSSLMLELSERSMMTDSSRIEIALDKLKNLGVRISIDDFGTGFSSLMILKQLPVSILKIDKSFVMKMATDKNDSLIVHSIIDLAHNLELQVIAEGVEDTESRELLKHFDCDYCQGYLFSMPLSEDNIRSLLDVINKTQRTNIQEL